VLPFVVSGRRLALCNLAVAGGALAAALTVARWRTAPPAEPCASEAPAVAGRPAVPAGPRLFDPTRDRDGWLALRLAGLAEATRGERAVHRVAGDWEPARPAATPWLVTVTGPATSALIGDRLQAALLAPPSGDRTADAAALAAYRAHRARPYAGALLYGPVAPGALAERARCRRFVVWASDDAIAVAEVATGRWRWIYDRVGAGTGGAAIEQVECLGDLVVAELHDDVLAYRWQIVVDGARGRWTQLPVELDRWSLDAAADSLAGVDVEGAPYAVGHEQLAALLD
jgi:hypothetical protein